ncbi:hypothetical protein GOODEAATRI_011045 [Goodea atripinnis]|uniref:Uncharacterized protein n=1 Tax=Goodea atripinnis TaxID=208336 RepID=A0ABV0PN08_9TELE
MLILFDQSTFSLKSYGILSCNSYIKARSVECATYCFSINIFYQLSCVFLGLNDAVCSLKLSNKPEFFTEQLHLYTDLFTNEVLSEGHCLHWILSKGTRLNGAEHKRMQQFYL